MYRLILVSLLAVLGAAEGRSAPDCQVNLHFTNRVGDVGIFGQQLINQLPGASQTVDNRLNGCGAWIFSYDSEGFSAASIVLQSAPATFGAPGTFVTFAGTTVSGNNPSTATTSANFLGTGYYPYLRVVLSSFTGTGSINASLIGYKSPTYVAGTGGGGGGSGISLQDNSGGVIGTGFTTLKLLTNAGFAFTGTDLGSNVGGIQISPNANETLRSMVFYFGGLSTGVATQTYCQEITSNGAISSVVSWGQESGTVTVGLKTVAAASYTGTTGYAGYTSIVAAAPPSISANYKYTDSTLTGWTLPIVAGDFMCSQVSSITNFTNLGIKLKYAAN